MVCLFLTWSLLQQAADECILNSACLVLTSGLAFLVAALHENVRLSWQSVLEIRSVQGMKITCYKWLNKTLRLKMLLAWGSLPLQFLVNLPSGADTASAFHLTIAKAFLLCANNPRPTHKDRLEQGRVLQQLLGKLAATP